MNQKTKNNIISGCANFNENYHWTILLNIFWLRQLTGFLLEKQQYNLVRPQLLFLAKIKKKKSRRRETPNLSTNADRSTDTN